MNNYKHNHTSCFEQEILPTPWFQRLNIPYDQTIEVENRLYQNADILVREGLVLVLNSTRFNKDYIAIPSIMLYAPMEMTLQ